MPYVACGNAYLCYHERPPDDRLSPLVITAAQGAHGYVFVQTVYISMETYRTLPGVLNMVTVLRRNAPKLPVPHNRPNDEYGDHGEEYIQEYKRRYIYPYHNITI
jgi:hypothetical protein